MLLCLLVVLEITRWFFVLLVIFLSFFKFDSWVYFSGIFFCLKTPNFFSAVYWGLPKSHPAPEACLWARPLQLDLNGVGSTSELTNLAEANLPRRWLGRRGEPPPPGRTSHPAASQQHTALPVAIAQVCSYSGHGRLLLDMWADLSLLVLIVLHKSMLKWGGQEGLAERRRR